MIYTAGSFTSTGIQKRVDTPSGVQRFKTYNLTQVGTAANPRVGLEFTWLNGMANGSALMTCNQAGTDILETYPITTGGFTIRDYTTTGLSDLRTNIDQISNAAVPVVRTTADHGLATGDVVRLYNVTNAPQLGGLDFRITVATPTTFTLDKCPQLAIAGTAAQYRVLDGAYSFTPERVTIGSITRGTTTTVTTLVPNLFYVDSEVRFNIQEEAKIVELNGLVGKVITRTDAFTFIVDIDSSSFTAFHFPAVADVPYTPATVTPVGASAGETLDALSATVDAKSLSILLPAGLESPAGQNNDIIYWECFSDPDLV